MKVVQIITSLNVGGAEKLLIDSLPFYRKNGIVPEVVYLLNKPTLLVDQLEKTHEGNHYGLTKGSVYNPLLIFKLIPFLRNNDIAHVHLFPSLYWVVLAKLISFSSIKIVYTEHSTNNRRRANALLKLIDRFIYRKVDTIITIADEVDKKLKSHLKMENVPSFRVINNGVNLTSFRDALPYPKSDFFDESSIILIQVSSFRYPKDQPTVIRAVKGLDKKVKLLLVGEGPLMEDNIKLVAGLNLQDRVLFLGLRDDVPRLLKTSDIVILSSAYEGLSLSSIEGMAVKPFIASDVPGLREIVNGYGMLFKQGDVRQLGENIVSLYSDRELYDRIATQCAGRAQEFDIEIMVGKYIDVYGRLLQA